MKKIEVNLITEIVVDDAIFFDTKVSKEIEWSIWKKPKIKVDSKKMINPKDKFNLMDNIKAIPNDAKIAVFWLSIIWLVIIAVNTLLWIHDQFSPEQATLFYSHYNSDWESSSPLGSALMSSWAMWAWVWYMMKKQLRKYMTFFYKKIKFNWSKTEKFRIRDLVWGTSRVDLKNVELKVVACNMEKWQYTRWSWSNKRTVSFSEPFNAISLYDKKIDFIPMNTEISEYFKWDISFEEMYKVLYPEQMLWNNHWLKVHWEVQLIHNKFIDQELIWDSKKFKFENFIEW